MWIAKPLSALTAFEASAWESAFLARRALDPETPLAQTLAWARAGEAVGAPAWLVFSPEESVGGVLLGTTELECINGPLLDWDDPSASARQFATFAVAASRLVPGFEALTMRPRWREEELERRLAGLPVEPEVIDRAATRIVRLAPTDARQVEDFSPRLRRSLRAATSHLLETGWERLSRERVAGFSREMRDFGATRGFSVPGPSWFEPLLEAGAQLSLWRAWAKVGEGTGADARMREAELVVAILGPRAHYLFGRGSEVGQPPASWSAAALAQFQAIRHSAAQGAREYDFNGALLVETPNDPYAGVDAFKRQFGGELVGYAIPRFVVRP